jgi:hypothetical protein
MTSSSVLCVRFLQYFYMQGVMAVRRGRAPLGGTDRPREGRGGNGGVHN